MNTLILLMPIIIMLSWARLIRPGANRIEGSVLMSVPMPLLARMRMHALPSALVLLLALILAIEGSLPWVALPILLAAIVVVVAIPVRYTLTDQGIRLGWGAFRRWTEFGGVRRVPGGARLQPVSGIRGMKIWLSRERGDDEFLHVIRTLIRDAYKGQRTVVLRPGTRYTAPTITAPPEPPTHGIAAFRRDPLR